MSFFETIKNDLRGTAGRTNQGHAGKDAERNRVNYGATSAFAKVLREMGHEIDIAMWEDDGYLKIEKITINGDLLIF